MVGLDDAIGDESGGLGGISSGLWSVGGFVSSSNVTFLLLLFFIFWDGIVGGLIAGKFGIGGTVAGLGYYEKPFYPYCFPILQISFDTY